MLHRPAENNILFHLFSNLFEKIYLFSQINTWEKIKIRGANSPNLLSFGDTKGGFSPVQFGKNCFAALLLMSTLSFLGSPWCFIYNIHSYHSTGSLVLQHFIKLGVGVVVVLINLVTAGFCDLGCVTPSEVDDIQILLNSMLVKGFSSIIEDQTWSTCVCQTRTLDATLAFMLQRLFQVLVAG